MSFEVGTFTPSEEDEYEAIMPLRPRQRHTGANEGEILHQMAMLKEQQNMIQTRGNADGADKNSWKDKIEFFERMKKVEPEKRKQLLAKVGKGMGKLKDLALLRGKNVKVKADDDRSDEIGT